MLTVTLYNMSAEDNRMDKSSFLSNGDFTVQAILKYPTNVTDPTIELRDVEGLQEVFLYNYAYIAEFKRYYFITNVATITNGVWNVSMHVDCLMTFKKGIEGVRVRVSRTSEVDKYNLELPDNSMKMEVIEQYSEVYTVSVPFINNITIGSGKPTNKTKCFVVTTVNQSAVSFNVREGTEISASDFLSVPASVLRGANSFITRWVCDQDEVVNFAKEALYDAQNVGSYIISIMAYPINFEELNASLGTNFLGTDKRPKLGDITIDGDIEGGNMYYLKSNASGILGKVSGDIIKVTRKYGDFRDFEPFTNFSVYLPYYGNYNIDPVYLYDGVNIEYLLDFATGELNIVLTGNTGIPHILIDTLKATLGVQVPISATDQANIDRRQNEITSSAAFSAIGSVVSMIAGVALFATGIGAPAGVAATAMAIGGASSFATGAVSGAGSAVNGIVQSSALKNSAVGGNGRGVLATYFSGYMQIVRHEYLVDGTPAEVSELYGRPSDYIGTVGDFYKGEFVMCEYVYMQDSIAESVDHDNPLKYSYQSERDEIISYLLHGIRT